VCYSLKYSLFQEKKFLAPDTIMGMNPKASWGGYSPQMSETKFEAQMELIPQSGGSELYRLLWDSYP
jgi:hypothetical protein